MADDRHFADDLISRVRDLGHPLCVGLDPHLTRIPPLFRGGRALDPADPDTASAVEAFLVAVIDRLAGRVAIVKPQIAFFEALGWRGLRTLTAVADRARGCGLLVLLDAKRGDIGSTAEGYAAAYLRRDAPLPADAMTVNPYLGSDTLEPFVAAAEASGGGLFVLVKTSNPGAGELQDRDLEGAPLFVRVAEMLAPLAGRLEGSATGWSSLGVVVGANWPAQAEQVRSALPHSLFLVPGYGAQGATATDAVRGFRPGPKGLEGGIVSSSRAVLFPADGHTDDATVWENAVDGALDASIAELGEAVSR
ncbi:MAG: orotidine-5'-phosphate decarboxylase [Proteobacteria bacterium]|nr:orotidine-5'-phosphate decarboxylase [Pseudomonadota bacterium]